jgi:hypothetical protein
MHHSNVKLPLLLAMIGSGCAVGEGALDSGVRFRQVAQFGCMDCSGPESFGGILSVSAGDGGIVAVLTSDSPYGRLIDVESREITSFAGEGDGPGEVRWPFGVAMLKDGGVLVAGRTTDVFDRSGHHLRRVIDESDEGYSTQQLVGAPSNEYVLDFRRGRYPIDSYHLRLLDQDGEVIRKVPFPEEIWSEEEDRTNLYNPRYAVSDSGRIAVGTGGGEYRIVLLDEGGAVVAKANRDIERPERTEEEKEELRSRMLIPLVDGIEPEIGDTWPHMGSMRFDDTGRLWVQTYRGRSHHTVFDLFSKDLTYLGEAELPGRIWYFQVRDGRLIAHVTGELDLPLVKIWRIVERSEAGAERSEMR